MGLFSRRHRDDGIDDARDDGRDDAADVAVGPGESTPSKPEDVGVGPWDAADAPDETAFAGLVDLGALRVPAVDGMQIRMERAGQGGEASAVVLILGGSTMELRAFAAPRTAGIWDELRADITAQLTRAKATFELVEGDYGTEIIAQLPVRTPEGRTGTMAARFIGVDGPRWFLRGVLQGRAATDPDAARQLREVFAGTVVVRDGVARPPREILPLHAPGATAAPEAEELPGLDPLQPGPTIAEVR
ncbi:DUF3710 domain-containing protein [Actinomyces sp. 432]|uniref:DUF3710 domain-containing protein n=1 Tax=Actinomyces sp. 432 TaxID=2057798 RepID=UPI00137412BA|nr:DUF3710 domain-containing protein [Actinomyces sp. 432]QHO90792.1 DUF3710 domain-containing protein [Actinomyces sp. 432]